MSAAEGRRSVLLRVSAVALGLAALIVTAVVLSSTPPEGPVDVDWDHVRCAHCGMLVSEPGFAAQLHRSDGTVVHYDDPGCLLASEQETDARAVYLHHHREARWIPLDEAAFVDVEQSPMGYGLAAVSDDEPYALDLAAARERVRARDAVRSARQ